MIISGTAGNLPATISITEGAVTASRGDDFVVAWDRAGRLYSFVDDGRTWRRGLSGRVLTKWRQEGRRERQWVSGAEANALVDRAAEFASGLLGAFEHPDARDALSRAARFDAAAAAADAEEFARVYQPVGILPPDQYLSLVLQATEGCSFRSCTFCEFYGESYRVKTAADFRAHVGRVLEYLGESLSLRRRALFLGAANALAIPTAALLPIFDVVAGEFSGRPVNAFVDGFTGSVKSVSDYAALGARGLHRVYIGLESGHDALLAFVGKPATSAQAVETVRAIRSAGVRVGVIVMVGLGGDRFAAAHVEDTATVLNRMELGPGDLLYFSELVDLPGSAYPRLAREAGIRPLDQEELVAQRDAVQSRLVFPGSPPRMATYDVREFVY